MPAKAPIYLKAGGKNASGNKGSKKLREILSTDMISPPLGDFRHMAHVGRGGTDDMFGDTSFLQKGNNTLPLPASRRGGSVDRKEKNGKKGHKAHNLSHEQSATLDRFRRKKRSAKSETSKESKDDMALSPVIQSALSLPILSSNNTDDEHSSSAQDSKAVASSSFHATDKHKSASHEEVFESPPAQENETPQKPSNGAVNAVPKPRRIMSNKGENTSKYRTPKEEVESPNTPSVDMKDPPNHSSEENAKKVTEQQEDDGWSLDLDLGPSLLDEVMGFLDKSRIVP